jgi:DNA-binding GntR family transcriptional regulator
LNNVYDIRNSEFHTMLPWITADTSDRIKTMRDTSLAKLVREDLLEHILKGDIKPGDRISEPDVASRLQVSRVPVREALRELESSGLVVSRKHAGVFVRAIEAKEVQDLYEIRSLLDSFAGAKAANLDPNPRQELTQALEASIALMMAAQKAANLAAYYSENLHFHWLIVQGAHNEQLSRTYQEVVQKLHLARLQSLSHVAGMKTSIAEHQNITLAIAKGDSERAKELLATHVASAFARLKPSITAEHSRPTLTNPKETT